MFVQSFRRSFAKVYFTRRWSLPTANASMESQKLLLRAPSLWEVGVYLIVLFILM